VDEVLKVGDRISGPEIAGDEVAARGGTADPAEPSTPGDVKRDTALLSRDRVAAFSDGVFAVAITLLVVGIPMPQAKTGQLAQALRGQWPSYVAYGISFLTIGIVWVNHHGTFVRVARVDRPLLFMGQDVAGRNWLHAARHRGDSSRNPRGAIAGSD